MIECSFINLVVVGSSPVGVPQTSDFALSSSKEFLEIQATIECRFTLKCVCDMTRTYSQKQQDLFRGRTLSMSERGPEAFTNFSKNIL